MKTPIPLNVPDDDNWTAIHGEEWVMEMDRNGCDRLGVGTLRSIAREKPTRKRQRLEEGRWAMRQTGTSPAWAEETQVWSVEVQGSELSHKAQGVWLSVMGHAEGQEMKPEKSQGSRLCWVCVSEMVLWPSLCFPLKRIFHLRDATLLKWMYKQAMNIFYIYIHMSRITVPHFNDQLSAPKWMTVWIGKPYVMFHTLILNSNIWGSDVCGLGFTKASFLWTVEEKPPQVSFPVNTTINSLSTLINWL